MVGPVTLHLVLPLPMNLANGPHSHWRIRHAAKLAYWKHCDLLLMLKTVPPPPDQPFPKAKISAVMHLGREMDTSNSMRRVKWIEDWLTTRGYIKDDSRKYLTWTGFPEQVIKRLRDRAYYIELTLTEAA